MYKTNPDPPHLPPPPWPAIMTTKGQGLITFSTCVLILVVVSLLCKGGEAQGGGSWEILVRNAGIASMHTAVTHYGTVVMLDRTTVGPSRLPGRCRDNPFDPILKHDCTAHSLLFTPATGAVRPLFLESDTWCSSAQFSPDGTLVQTGGNNDGFTKIRRFSPCPATNNTCDWSQSETELLQNGRWYASNQILPDGRQIIVGGRLVFTYEFFPPSASSSSDSATPFPFLQETNDPQNDNMYPFLHLLPDGNLFIFANRDSVVFNYKTNAVIKRLPTIPGEPRNYPSAGSSVMLPLLASQNFTEVEIMVCGGAKYGAFLNPLTFLPASDTCGRISLSDSAPSWLMETMPIRRAMGDMLLLPTGHPLLINGVQNGCQGWGNGKNPVLTPVIYSPDAPAGKRFNIQSATTIPRVYHSTANLLPDGRVLVAGGNAHQFDTFTGELPTELRVEAYLPEYLSATNDVLRPEITSAPRAVNYGQNFSITVILNAAAAMATTTTTTGEMELTLTSSPFTTHSFSQGLRQLRLSVLSQIKEEINNSKNDVYRIISVAPPSPTVAPPSYYMLFAINQGIPSSSAIWLHIS